VAIGQNPRLIRGDPALPIQLARGLRGTTRISSYVEPGGTGDRTDLVVGLDAADMEA